MRYCWWLLIVCLGALQGSCGSGLGPRDSRLEKAFRLPSRNGWTYVHLEGQPGEIGFQHGWLLAHEIAELRRVFELELVHDTQRPWGFFVEVAKAELWPRIEREYQEELEGIIAGMQAQGVPLGLWDLVVMNAALELNPYYVNWADQQHERNSSHGLVPTADRCSAFVATGSFTQDGKIVIGHNNWSSYLEGARWKIIFDIVPAHGHHVLMDGMAGLIHSGDDFGIKSAGIMITETTITQFHGWDPKGTPEFVRARQAMQYSDSIDQFVQIMKRGNNGGYANNWLVGDLKVNEIASLELGLIHVTLRRTQDGYFSGANFPVDDKLIQEETTFDSQNKAQGSLARRTRWDQLINQQKGKIDLAAGQRFLADHFDVIEGTNHPSERTLCGHIDFSPRGSLPWQPPFGPAGAVQAKITDSTLAAQMTLVAAVGHPCGIRFRAAEHLAAHPEFDWQKLLLKDLDAFHWTTFRATP
ncbi:MAG: C45 family peptidase [Terriglobia bacterium]